MEPTLPYHSEELTARIFEDVVAQDDWLRTQVRASRMELTRYHSEAIQAQTQRLRWKVYGKSLRELKMEAPADWWQAFKDRWFPLWAKKRWPVKYTTQTVDVWALFPDLPLPDRYGPTLRFHVFMADPEERWPGRLPGGPKQIEAKYDRGEVP